MLLEDLVVFSVNRHTALTKCLVTEQMKMQFQETCIMLAIAIDNIWFL